MFPTVFQNHSGPPVHMAYKALNILNMVCAVLPSYDLIMHLYLKLKWKISNENCEIHGITQIYVCAVFPKFILVTNHKFIKPYRWSICRSYLTQTC